ncbi:helix-turn-helix domain-containing protein [Frankia sp. EAN1pec]|uniref:helix-turn-helix domain-containing protein n=1 Tax=Parafrankia sp. (strain EAN1pec) TaxID=298653 RepID=UPI0002F1FE09
MTEFRHPTGEILGIGRTASYELARQGKFPVTVIRVGRRYIVPTSPLKQLLGIDTESDGHA